MLIVLDSILFDIDGHIEIEVDDLQNDGTTTRRVNRVRLLNGETTYNDGGYAEGDRDLDYTWVPATEAQNDLVARMVRLYSQFYCSTPKGVYTVRPEGFNPDKERSRLRLFVVEKLV